VFNIIDENTKNYFIKTGLDYAPGGIRTPITKVTDFDIELKQALEQGAENIFMANSLEELASQTCIEFEGLQRTIEEYNKACDIGRDEVLGKNARYLRPVREPKFYASKSVFDPPRTMEGIKVNHNTEVISEEYKKIPGIYAAGMDLGPELYTYSYPYSIPGNAIGFALNSGRIAGENAALFALK
jgi:fumarate reductase flavoprotein subunit